MSHTGGKEGTYPGTRASATMIGDDETNWGTKSLAILDMPFTAVMDTLLLPWDVFRKDSSVRSRVEKSEANAQATNAVIPPANFSAACRVISISEPVAIRIISGLPPLSFNT